MLKVCTKCRIQQKSTEFYKRTRSKDGLFSWCKKCHNQYYYHEKRDYYVHEYPKNYNLLNKEKIKEKQRKYRVENRDYLREHDRKRYLLNRTERIKKQRERDLMNWEVVSEYRKEWRKKNKEKRIQYYWNRAERILRNGGNLNVKEWLLIKKKYGNKCLACGVSEEKVAITLDHIIPIIHGGRHSIDNVQPLCKSCNSKKATKIIDYRNICE